MSWLYRYQMCHPPASTNNLTRNLFLLFNRFHNTRHKIFHYQIAHWPMTMSIWPVSKYVQFPIQFKLLSNPGLTNFTKLKSDFVLRKLPPRRDLAIVDFMNRSEDIDKDYNKSFAFWLIIVITLCSTVVSSPLIFLFIWWKCIKNIISVMYCWGRRHQMTILP